MPDTQTMRNLYPELVVGGVTSDWTVLPNGPICNYTGTTTRAVFYAPAFANGRIALRFHPVITPWASALAAVFYHYRYPFRELAGGSVSCRAITNGTRTSPHAHGVAIDINPSTNRYRVSLLGGLIQWGRETDMPMEMVEAAEAMRTTTGRAVTSWGGRWNNIKDPMHYEASKCYRSDLVPGIDLSTVVGWQAYLAWRDGTPIPEPGDDMTVEQFVKGLSAQPQQIDKLIDAKVIGTNDPAGAKAYYRSILNNPDNPDWLNFIVAVQTESALSGRTHPNLTINLAGTAKP